MVELSRLRLTCKQGAASLGIRPEKWTQGGKAAFLKVAKCLIDDPAGAQIELAFAIAEALECRNQIHRPATPSRASSTL